MTQSQLQRRQVLLHRQNKALDRWPAPSPRERTVSPHRTDPGFIREMTTVIEELTALARKVDSQKGEDQLERCRNWRYVGNSCFDLANASDMTMLRRATDAYDKADALVAGAGDDEEKFKLDYAYGHAFLHLSHGTDLPLLEQARRRYASAVETARSISPSSARHIEMALQKAQTLIAELPASGSSAVGGGELQKEAAAVFGSPMQDDALLATRLGKIYAEDVSSGKASATEQQALDPVVYETQRLMQESGQDLPEQTIQISSLLEMASRTVGLQASQAGSTLPEGSRAAAVWKHFSALKLYVSQDAIRMISQSSEGRETRAAGFKLVQRCASAYAFMHEPGRDDKTVLSYERDELRQLAVDLRAFSLRRHLTLISPRWPSTPLPLDPNAVFFSGCHVLRELVVSICIEHGLKIAAPAASHDFASTRWNQLRACNVAVFDFTSYEPPGRSRRTRSAASVDMAAVAYELGLALALGRTVVVLAKEGQQLPFDVDVQPVRLEDDGRDGAVAGGITNAIYSLQRAGDTSSILATRDYLNQVLAGKDLITECLVKLIDDDAVRDPVKFRRMMQPVLGRLDRPAQMVFPAWPGSYPVAGSRTCFHVTPFGPRWAGATRKIVEAACAAANPAIRYVRGDEVLEPNILRSIWDGLCQASEVVIDLTGLNANVMLELGFAHALGRKVLLVSQDKVSFPSIAKERTHLYSTTGEPGLKALQSVVRQFLSGRHFASSRL